MTNERPRLRSIELTGPRALIRTIAFYALLICSLAAAIGYVAPAHRLRDEHFHSNFDDGGIGSLLVLVALGVGVFLLRRMRFGGGMIAGVVAAGGAVLALAPVLLAHFLSSPEYAWGEHLFAIGELGLFFGGAALLLAEPVLYLLERRRIERASRPAPLPAARVFA